MGSFVKTEGGQGRLGRDKEEIWKRFLAPLTFAVPFSAKKQACGPEARALRGKSIGPGISDCGLRISDFFAFLFQSTIRNFIGPIEDHLEVAPSGIRFERFTVFQASGPAGVMIF